MVIGDDVPLLVPHKTGTRSILKLRLLLLLSLGTWAKEKAKAGNIREQRWASLCFLSHLNANDRGINLVIDSFQRAFNCRQRVVFGYDGRSISTGSWCIRSLAQVG